MKDRKKAGNVKAKMLGSAILLATGLLAQPAFGDAKVTYNPGTGYAHLPTVHSGTDQFEIKMKRLGELFTFAVTESSLISKLTFEDSKDSSVNQTLTLTELIDRFSSKEIDIYDPIENRSKTFRVIETNAVLDFVYPSWRNREEFSIAAIDGFISPIAVEQFTTYKSYLAFEQIKRPQFVLVKASDGKYVELGPFWLVWDNGDTEGHSASNTYFWPYQASSFDLVTFKERFANAAPPTGSPKQVEDGFVAARKYCLPCHQVNGDGGNKAPDLIEKKLVEEHTDSEIENFILNVEAAPESGMALRDEIPNRKQVAKDIIVYLNKMDANK